MPGISPYVSFLNNPICFNDPLGDTCVNGIVYDEGAGTGKTLDNVTVTSTKKSKNVAQGNIPTVSIDGTGGSSVGDKKKNIGSQVIDIFVERLKSEVVFVASAANSIATNMVAGAGRSHPPTTAGVMGAKTGDAISLVIGMGEAVIGGGAALFLTPTLLIPGVGEVAVGGSALISAHGALVTVPTAWNNLLKIEETNDYIHKTPPQNEPDLLKGGKQNQRDSDIKQYPKDFQRWYHRDHKEPGDPNATKEELKKLYKEWQSYGSPKTK